MKVTTQPNTNSNGPRYVTKELNYMFDKILKELVAMKFRMENSEASLDSDLALHIK
jgi:succinylglutamate desuccinylase